MLGFIFFFFFQAEDGIRDRTVTGVQTCALPIYKPQVPGVPVGTIVSVSNNAGALTQTAIVRPAVSFTSLGVRSEERRVGKECRARRWPDGSKTETWKLRK